MTFDHLTDRQPDLMMLLRVVLQLANRRTASDLANAELLGSSAPQQQSGQPTAEEALDDHAAKRQKVA